MKGADGIRRHFKSTSDSIPAAGKNPVTEPAQDGIAGRHVIVGWMNVAEKRIHEA